MSGIVGICYPGKRPVETRNVENMAAALAHRGPHGAGVWTNGSVGLGHRMLWTTHESRREPLPLVDSKGELVITADARLDNRSELMSLLGINDFTLSDAALILLAYEEWGLRCPSMLLGDFAFAVWDSRQHRLFCARDHFGVKPFFYYRSDRSFVFASEIKALLRVEDVPRRLNETRVGDYLIGALDDKAMTFYQDIFRLPAGHYLVVAENHHEVQSYWSPDPERELRLGSDEEYAEAFRKVFQEAVSCRMRDVFPVGSTLSGGLDSSSISCMARHLLQSEGRGELHTFSVLFDEVPESDERQYINSVLQQDGFKAHFVRGDTIGPLHEMERFLWHQDEPFYAPNLFLNWAINRCARQQGVGVILNGYGGDAVVSHGTAFLAELARSGRWITLAREIASLSRNQQRPAWDILKAKTLAPLAPSAVRRLWRLMRGRTMSWSCGNGTIKPEFARRVGLEERAAKLGRAWTAPVSTARQDHCRHLTWGYYTFGLEIMDRVAAAHSVEVRYPFYDLRVAELCLALPPEQKLSNGWTRMIMRRAMKGLLPEAIRWRAGKASLAPNFLRGFALYERSRIEEVIFEKPDLLAEYIDIQTLRQAYERYVKWKNGEDWHHVWIAVTLGLWLERAQVEQ